MTAIPARRLRAVNEAPVRGDGRYVIYWMTAARRTRHNFGLQHAVARAAALGRPLLIFEPLRAGYRWACDRFHQFVIDGMRDQAARCAEAGVQYLSYLEPEPGAGRGLLARLAADASCVVTDDFPCFFLPRMLRAAGARLDCRLEAVDSLGVLSLRASPRVFTTAASFRRHFQKVCGPDLEAFPVADPLAAAAELGLAEGPEIEERWPSADPTDLGRLPIDHNVPVSALRGGEGAARAALGDFLRARFPRYADARNHPDDDVASGLSAYLHFGHLSAHEIAGRIFALEDWRPGDHKPRATGSRDGWWQMSAPAESFLDELITWRELGHVFCAQRPDDYDRYESLPGWAQQTLAEHAGDARPAIYPFETLDEARTDDEIWNAAQRQLRAEGKMHNYLRMLWGKRVLEWSETPQQALARLIEMNNKWALDGRDPNSYSGIFWIFGRFDRAWGPERPIFGKVRYMSSQSTRRKLRLREYLARWGA